MYRKFTIKDTAGLKLIFEIHPAENNKMIVIKDEIPLTVKERQWLINLINTVNAFMEGNSVCNTDIEEIT